MWGVRRANAQGRRGYGRGCASGMQRGPLRHPAFLKSTSAWPHNGRPHRCCGAQGARGLSNDIRALIRQKSCVWNRNLNARLRMASYSESSSLSWSSGRSGSGGAASSCLAPLLPRSLGTLLMSDSCAESENASGTLQMIGEFMMRIAGNVAQAVVGGHNQQGGHLVPIVEQCGRLHLGVRARVGDVAGVPVPLPAAAMLPPAAALTPLHSGIVAIVSSSGGHPRSFGSAADSGRSAIALATDARGS